MQYRYKVVEYINKRGKVLKAVEDAVMKITAMKNKEAYRRILPYIEQASRDYYNDNLEKGFLD